MMRPRRSRLAPEELLDVHVASEGRKGMKRAVGSGVRWMGSSQVAGQLIRVASTLVLTRLLSPEDFGIVALVTVVTGLFERVLGDTGTTTAIVRTPSLSQSLASSVLYWNVAIGVATSAMFVAGGGLIADLLGEPDAANVVRLLGCMALINGASFVPRALFRRKMQFRKLASVNLINAGATSVGTIAFAVAGMDEWSIVFGTLIGSFLATTLSWVLSDWRPALHFSRASLREISNFSANLSFQNLFGYVSYAGDRFIIGRFIGTAELGYYGLANRLMRYPLQTSAQTYREVVFPGLARVQDDFAAMAKAYERSVTGISFLIFPLCATVAAVAGPLVPVALGPKWEPVTTVLALVAVTSGLQTVALTTGSLYNSRGRSDLSLRWQIASSIVLFVSYAIGAIWGVEGVAWGYLVGTAVLTYPAFAIPLRLIGASAHKVLRGSAESACAAAVAGVAGWAAVEGLARSGSGDLLQLVAGLATCISVYGLYVLVRRPPVARELIGMIRR